MKHKLFNLFILLSLFGILMMPGTVLAQGPSTVLFTPSSSKTFPSAIGAPATPQDLAIAMGINPSDIISASLNGSDVGGTGIATTPLGTFFPRGGSTFAILSTGLAASADDPNNEGNLSFELSGLDSSEGFDMTQLALQLSVPANMNCASFDFVYFSEEFPEFVGSIFNDAFTAEIGGTNLSVVDNHVVAPFNFAFDAQGNVVSVNTVFGVTSNTGTTYDGATTLLRARTPVTPGSNAIFVFSVQDLGDSIYDSAVFLDAFSWSNDPQCAVGSTDYTTFYDVPTNYWSWSWIERLYSAGITSGCGGGNYCPESDVTRAQMAIFLERGMHGSTYTPPAVGASTGFNDVPTNYWAAAWIKQLAADGITGGCGAGIYCPDDVVTRGQMAVFLLKAEHGSSYTPPAVGSSTGFSDVPTNYWSAAWIKQLAAEGITAGCSAGVYCPESPVTRAQMAVFLVRTFNLP